MPTIIYFLLTILPTLSKICNRITYIFFFYICVFFTSVTNNIFHRPIHGLIFLFKWVQDDELSGNIVQDSRLDKIFFAKQVYKVQSKNIQSLESFMRIYL